MIVENKGGKGNPYHDEEGKFTTGSGASEVSIFDIAKSNYSKRSKDEILGEFQKDNDLSKLLLKKLNVEDYDTFLNALNNMEQMSPDKFDKFCDFLDGFIDKNKIEENPPRGERGEL